LSTTAVQLDTTCNWKQEVSRRIAEYKSRNGMALAQPEAPAWHGSAAKSRKAQAAARVAARYAQAPSFSQMQAAEVQAALRTAGIATQAAWEANHAAQTLLSGLQNTSVGPRLVETDEMPSSTLPGSSEADWEWRSEPPVELPALPQSLEEWESASSHYRRKPEVLLSPVEAVEYRAFRPEEDEEFRGSEAIVPVEPDTPIQANVIEFPRELVATRKMRPRRVEGANATAGLERQLSIFEVDPGAISFEPEAAEVAPESSWPEPEWSGIELEAQLPGEPEIHETPSPLPEVELAPMGDRLIAALMDISLIAAAFMGAALAAVTRIGHLPMTRIADAGAVSAFLLFGLLYYSLFLTLSEITPGMKCARIALCTFDGRIPTRAELRSRLGALLLSLVPVGLGIAWALFDDDHLCWHDRLSRTYLRKC
jgi:uncharacterized RDD family membrane protein YckC